MAVTRPAEISLLHYNVSSSLNAPMTNKDKIISLLEKAISINVIGKKQYESRFKGFIGELDFPQFAEETWPNEYLISGGYLVSPISGVRSIENPVYFNTGTREADHFLEAYKRLAKLGCSSLFYFQFEDGTNIENWANNELPKGFISPPLRVYEYNKGDECFASSSKNSFCSLFRDRESSLEQVKIPEEIKIRYRKKLSAFSESSLAELYFQRLIFDTLIGGPKVHGIPSDIDFIAYSHRRKRFVIIEIKEKDLSKREPKGFGMDIPRMNDLIKLQEKTEMPAFYIVREIADQKARKFLRWRSISLDTFSQNLGDSIQGGSGMGFENGRYPTKVCPQRYFKRLE
jgi:hypothetical protein